MSKAIYLKTISEEDQFMKIYFLDPPIVFNRYLDNLVPLPSCLVGFHYSPSEGGQIVQIWELNEQLRLLRHVSFEKIMPKLQQQGYDPESQDPTPILEAFGYKTIENEIQNTQQTEETH